MKSFHEIISEKKKQKTFTLDQINNALIKFGIGPAIVGKFMLVLNAARGLGIIEAEISEDKE